MRRRFQDWIRWYLEPTPSLSFRARRWHRVWLYALPLSAGLHFTTLVTFALLDVPILLWFNAASVPLYLILAVLYRQGHHKLVFRLTNLEVVVHAGLVVQQIGWAAGFQQAILLIAIQLGAPSLSRRERVVHSVATVAAFIGFSFFGPPAVTLTAPAVWGLALFTGLAAFAVVGLMVGMLDATADRLEADLAQEHARAESLLNDEVRRQVVERSRELSEALAQVARGPVSRLQPGDIVEQRYRLVRVLGEGGMGRVYEVERLTDGKRLALKMLTGAPNQEVLARFAREAQIAAELQHPNVVSVLDVGLTASGLLFLVMELVSGSTLEREAARVGDTEWAHGILTQIAEALAAMHAQGIVHRDLKPSNVLLDGSVVKVADFGIASLTRRPAAQLDAVTVPQRASFTHVGAFLGTPEYMAPELALGVRDAEPSSDLWSFGVVAHELLTGRSPFVEPPVLALQSGRPVHFANVDRDDHPLWTIINRCLREDPRERPTAQRVVAMLDGQLQPREPDEHLPEQPWTRQRRDGRTGPKKSASDGKCVR